MDEVSLLGELEAVLVEEGPADKVSKISNEKRP